MPSNKTKFGIWGENQAEIFLKNKNYRIIEKNYRKRCGEIDIIAIKNEILHFIEVKTRNNGAIEKYGMPEEAVNIPKREKIIETAYHYLEEKGVSEDLNWQIDVISIIYSSDSKTAKIKHIINAFDENNTL